MKYKLIETNIEILRKNENLIKPFVTIDQNENDLNYEVVKEYESEKEALNDLNNYESEIVELSSSVGKYYAIKEYIVMTEDDDILDFIEVSKMIINVVSKPGYETIKTFDNLKEAKEFSLEYSDKEDIETWISFN